MFALLPINEAIRWLDAFSSDDEAKLLDFADARLKARAYRDVSAALAQAPRFKPMKTLTDRANKLQSAVDAQAGPQGKELLTKIRSGKAGWIDALLAYRDDFQFAAAAKDTMTAFDELRAKQSPPARDAYNEARGLFQQGKVDDGYKKYQEIVDKYPASPLYRTVKRTLAERR